MKISLELQCAYLQEFPENENIVFSSYAGYWAMLIIFNFGWEKCINDSFGG